MKKLVRERLKEDWAPEYSGDTPADQGIRAARRDYTVDELKDVFDAVSTARAELDDIRIADDEKMYELTMDATDAIEKIMDYLDSKLQSK